MVSVRLIDAEELSEKIEEEFDGVCAYDVSPDEAVNDFQDIVDSCKTIDAAPVVHGQWILSTDMTYMPQCSNCGRHPFKGYIPSIEEVRRVYKYCPVCGAKMDGRAEP